MSPGSHGSEEPICPSCGNTEDYCHQTFFGFFLTHEAITMYKDHKDPDSVTEDMITSDFLRKYNILLRFTTFAGIRKYDTKTFYSLPGCIEAGSLSYTHRIIQQQQIYSLLKNKRVFGVARNLMFNGYHAKRGDGSDSDDDSDAGFPKIDWSFFRKAK